MICCAKESSILAHWMLRRATAKVRAAGLKHPRDEANARVPPPFCLLKPRQIEGQMILHAREIQYLINYF
eukprot:SAG31_NODE_57_length_29727_cov_12.584568_15_plen_70_part_00